MPCQNRVMFAARRVALTLTLTFLTLWGVPPASASADCSEASFRLAQNFNMVTTPHAFVAADFNGDGRPDIASAAAVDVEVRLNDGTGWFGAPAHFDAGGSFHGLAAGDFNGDGRTDLVVAHSSVNNVSLLPGNGAGGFGAPVHFAVGKRPLSVVAADFNGDGKPDVAVSDFEDDSVSVLLGDGAGGLSIASTLLVGGFPESLVAADFNNDGRRDLAINNFQNVIVLLGDGAGSFAPPRIALTGNVTHLVSADFNADGKADLAAAGRAELPAARSDGSITLLLGDGAGGFSAPTLIATGRISAPTQIAAADFNGDGKFDLAAALQGWSSVAVLLGDGSGGFGVPRTFGAGNLPSVVVAADFNGDGASDLAVGTSSNGGGFGDLNGFLILLNSGGGDFHAAPSLPVNTSSPSLFPRKGPGKIALADFNNDGRTDLAVSNNLNVSIDSGAPTVSILLADGAGGFTAAPDIAFQPGRNIGSIAAADFNKDGKGDLAVAIPFNVSGNANTVAIYLGDGAGGFSVHTHVPVFTPNDLEVTDLNSDSKPDLVVKKNDGFVALLGDGAGNFTALEGPAGGPSSADIAVGDFNTDGKPDVAVTDPDNGKVYVTLGLGNGTFDFMRHITVGARPLAVTFADFNGDGIQDMATARAATFDSGLVTILLGTGTGLFGPPTSYGVRAPTQTVAVGDFNADGKPDLVVEERSSSSVAVLTGNGDGTFRPPVSFGINSWPSHVVVHDFNADGKPDVAASQADAHTVALLLNNMTSPLPCLSVADANFTEGDAGDAEAEFVVTLSGATDKTVRVNYDLGSIPAIAGQDFRGGPGSLTFPPGTTSQKLKLAIIGDITDEDDESFRVTLRSPSNALISDGAAVGNILDNDPGPSISVGDVSAAEGNSFGSASVLFNVTLSTPSTKPITVQYSTSPGTATETAATGDYLPASGTLQFGAGQATRTVEVTIRGDGVHESDETFSLILSSPTNATLGDGTAVGNILNDDPVPRLSILNGSATETPSGAAVRVRVSLSNPSDRTVTVAYATADATATAGSDYVAASDTLTFSPGELEKAFDVAVTDDAEDEVNETFTVVLSNPTNAVTAAEPGVYTIFDNDGPAISVNDVSVVEGQGGRTLANFTLSLSAPSPQTVSVRVATANGTATAGTFFGDYQPVSNRFVVFAAGSTATTLTVVVNGDQTIEPDETFFLNLSQPLSGTIADAQGLGTITNDDTTSVRFSTDSVTANEADGSVQVTVTRVGDLSGVFAAVYATNDGTASARSDYNASLGTLRFEPNETSKTITVFITNDALVEDAEFFSIALSGAAGGATNAPSVVSVIINSDDAAPGPNPVDDSAFFVRQHYRDFLGRDPDDEGLAFWTNEIESCGADAQCREVKRINVSAAFFLSIEFQETGFLAYRAHKAAYGDATSSGVPGTVPVITLAEFLTDAQKIGQGVRVNVGDWQRQLEENKNTYALEFVQRARFLAAFPAAMTAEEFVTKLEQNTGTTLSSEEKAALVSALGATPADAAKRAQVLRAVAEDADLRRAEFNRAFVLMQYFGYLRRNPDDAPEPNLNFAGWAFWLGKLNEFNGNFVQAEMVNAFLTSTEYRQRFGQ